jgi:hypothetical protein
MSRRGRIATHIANVRVKVGEVSTDEAIDCFMLMSLQQLVQGIGLGTWTRERFGLDCLAGVDQIALRVVRSTDMN